MLNFVTELKNSNIFTEIIHFLLNLQFNISTELESLRDYIIRN